jgi:hypothetical protein
MADVTPKTEAVERGRVAGGDGYDMRIFHIGWTEVRRNRHVRTDRQLIARIDNNRGQRDAAAETLK